MIVVIQNYMAWLPLTENWIYKQVKNLPDSIQNHVVCKHTENLDVFSLPHIHCWDDHGWLSTATVVIRGLFKSWPYFHRHGAHLIHVADRYGASLVHSHFGYMGWHCMRAIRRAGLRHVVSFYGVDASRLPRENPVWKDRYAEMFSVIDTVLCEGPCLARNVIDLGCPPDKVKVHHLGVNIDEIPFKSRRWNGQGPLRVLIAASFREKKGIPYGLEALGRLSPTIPLEVTIIGDAGTTEEGQREKDAILRAIDRHSLAPHVRFMGFQSHVRLIEEAWQHHVFLSPSVTSGNGDTEGGAPVSIIEMAASGMPVVSTMHCDIPEVIQNEVGGLLAEEKDVDGLAERIEWLAQHPDSWADMTMAARKRIEEEFDARKQGIKLAAVYQRIVNG